MLTDRELDELLELVRARERPAIAGEPFTHHDDEGEVVLVIPKPWNIGDSEGYRRRPPDGPWESIDVIPDWLKPPG